MKHHSEIQGALVTLQPKGGVRPLDGFWAHGRRRARSLLIFVHGMHSNFYRSAFKKQLMSAGPALGVDVLSFNNRGADTDTETERFRDCLADIDAAVAFGKSHGYKTLVLIGHSTGCQKITYWQHVRKSRSVRALVLAAIGDDYAIFRKDLGKHFLQRVKQARRWISSGRKNRAMPLDCRRFTAQRFLSVADPRQIEARLFNFAGPLREFGRIKIPVLALFPEREEFACISVDAMSRLLGEKTRSRRFTSVIVPNAGHSFRGTELVSARAVFGWLKTL